MAKINGAALHQGPFCTGVVDPPWPYKQVTHERDPGGNKLSGYVAGGTKWRGRESSAEYNTLSIGDLAALPVGNLISGYLFLWTPGPFLERGFELINAWGFRYATALHWLKKTEGGAIPYGAGYWYRGAIESILVAKKPGVPSVRTHQRNVFEAVRLGHSTKPESFQDHVEKYFPGPYVELFARRVRPGWLCLGDECPGDGGDIRDSLPKAIDGSFQKVSADCPLTVEMF